MHCTVLLYLEVGTFTVDCAAATADAGAAAGQDARQPAQLYFPRRGTVLEILENNETNQVWCHSGFRRIASISTQHCSLLVIVHPSSSFLVHLSTTCTPHPLSSHLHLAGCIYLQSRLILTRASVLHQQLLSHIFPTMRLTTFAGALAATSLFTAVTAVSPIVQKGRYFFTQAGNRWFVKGMLRPTHCRLCSLTHSRFCRCCIPATLYWPYKRSARRHHTMSARCDTHAAAWRKRHSCLSR